MNSNLDVLRALAVYITLAQSVSGFLKVLPDELFGGFEFKTARYSLFIGDFSSECSIVSVASILAPDEDLCDLSTISTQVNGTILFNIATVNGNCHPETAYHNAESLGALVLVDVFPIAPGVLRYSRSVGEAANHGSIPFLQTGTEFIGGILLNPDIARLFSTLTIQIDGCADESVWQECFDVKTSAIYVPTGVLAFVFALYSLLASCTLTRNPTTSARIFLLRFVSFTLFYTSFIFSLGMFTQYQFSWLTRDLVPDSIQNGLAMLVLGLHLQVILLAALYWRALRSGTFKPDGQTAEFWNKAFFHHPVFFASFLVGAAYTLLGYRALELLFEDSNYFRRYTYALFAIQISFSLYFGVSVSSFIVKIRKFLAGLSNNTDVTKRKSPVSKCFLMNTDVVTAGPLRHLLHFTNVLMYSLLAYIAVIIVSHVFVPFLFFENLPLETLQDDSAACNFSTMFGGYNCLRTLSTCILAVGLGWTKTKPTKTALIPSSSQSNRNKNGLKDQSSDVEYISTWDKPKSPLIGVVVQKNHMRELERKLSNRRMDSSEFT